MATFGTFIQPDSALQDAQDPAATLNVPVFSGFQSRASLSSLLGQNRIFDAIAARITQLDLRYEDQCSAGYYFDLVQTLRDLNGQFDRLVEVGVFMGGASSYFAGCIEPFDFDLDMVDVSPEFLRFSYERVRRMYPEAAGRIRLFHGDLPAYVRHVMLKDAAGSYVIYHDGSHEFTQVVKDMAALYYAKERILAIIAQDTHLRGTVQNMNFVDMALYAVFGIDLKFAPIGAVYIGDNEMTRPNCYQGNYFLPQAAEGMVLPMAANHFVYPHAALNIDDFLPLEHATLEVA